MKKIINYLIHIFLLFYCGMLPFGILFQIYSTKSTDSPFYVHVIAHLTLIGFLFYFVVSIISLLKNRILLPKIYLVLFLLYSLVLFGFIEGDNIINIFFVKSLSELFYLSLALVPFCYALYNLYLVINIKKKC